MLVAAVSLRCSSAVKCARVGRVASRLAACHLSDIVPILVRKPLISVHLLKHIFMIGSTFSDVLVFFPACSFRTCSNCAVLGSTSSWRARYR